jgi:hypothetical protein
MIEHETRTLRHRQADLDADADARDGITIDCGASLVAVTFAEAAYPTVASAFYACHPVALGGTEDEGQAVTTTTDGTQKLYAANLGTAIPPSGTKVLITLAGNRWEFTWNG